MSVPFMIYRKSTAKDNGIETFTENTAKDTGNYIEIGYTLMDKFINE